MIRFWPHSLAGRLVILLVAALAAAQLGLVLMLRGGQDSIVEEMVHGQALTQTVTLARLLAAYPISEGEMLANTFGSKQSCARILDRPPTATSATEAERHLATLLALMLHGVEAGQPQVTIERLDHHDHPCDDAAHPYGGRETDDAASGIAGSIVPIRARTAAVEMSVPLPAGRWLTMRTAVGVPDGWSRNTLISFLLSSLAVAIVVVVSVRTQTRSLRALADAADRFGRGETLEQLPIAGPTEVAAATRAFNTMQDRLSRFVRDRLRLLAGISHDLRTPLTTLRLKAEFIEDGSMRDDIVATIDELSAIAEATLAFTRAEATTEATEEVDIPELVEGVAAAFRLADADVIVVPSPPLPYACRPVSLKRAFRNVIENAVRYGGKARIAIAASEAGPVITVDDDGPGLPPDRIEDAFQPFVRLEPSRSAETGGIGLGLAIARSIVKAHGGTLTLANRPEGGLRAEISLPMQPK